MNSWERAYAEQVRNVRLREEQDRANSVALAQDVHTERKKHGCIHLLEDCC
jgi:hypothetical protein